jgi:phage-related protein (TIGR01555 family)
MPEEKAAEETQVFNMMDAFQNAVTRTGLGMNNHIAGTSYPLIRLTKDWVLLTTLYRNSWIVRRIIDTIPADMTKNWIDYRCDLNPIEIQKLSKTERQTWVKPSILQGLCMGRLYGGCAGVMVVDGQDNLEEPLDVDAILPGDFKRIIIRDRWNGLSTATLELVDDIQDPDFGLPKFYEFSDSNNMASSTYKVHHSRVLRFTGDDLPRIEKVQENYWGASKIESVYEELVKVDNTSWNLVGMLFLANIRVMKLKGLDQVLAAGNQAAQQKLFSSVQAINELMNNFSMQVIGSEESIENISSSFSGTAEVFEKNMVMLAGASNIPATKLYGRSPEGMNATGESDMRNYYDYLSQEQDSILRPVLDKLTPVIAMSTWGRIPDDFEYFFNPVETPSDAKIGETVKWKTEAIFGASDRGIITPRCAVMELKEMSNTTGVFTNITDENIADAEDEVIDPMLEMEMGEKEQSSDE